MCANRVLDVGIERGEERDKESEGEERGRGERKGGIYGRRERGVEQEGRRDIMRDG
jgi:hypothetical protein